MDQGCVRGYDDRDVDARNRSVDRPVAVRHVEDRFLSGSPEAGTMITIERCRRGGHCELHGGRHEQLSADRDRCGRPRRQRQRRAVRDVRAETISRQKRQHRGGDRRSGRDQQWCRLLRAAARDIISEAEIVLAVMLITAIQRIAVRNARRSSPVPEGDRAIDGRNNNGRNTMARANTTGFVEEVGLDAEP